MTCSQKGNRSAYWINHEGKGNRIGLNDEQTHVRARDHPKTTWERGDRSAIGVSTPGKTRATNVEHTTMPPVFFKSKSPAEERAVGDSAFCF